MAEQPSGYKPPTPAPVNCTDPCTLAIFGARGDLARRKLWPALYNLEIDGALPTCFIILGLGRHEVTREDFQREVQGDIYEFSRRPLDAAVWERFCARIHYFVGDLKQAAMYTALAKQMTALERACGTQGNRVFYCAVPPSVTPALLEQLQAASLLRRQAGKPWTRVVLEKPFGRDLASARALNGRLRTMLDESQIYRIDHYLAKETVQNILVFRFANLLFEPAWDRRSIDSVQITMAESIGIGERGTFYEETGVVRDVMQNHLLQLLALVAMEPPVVLDAESFRDEVVKVLRAVRPALAEDAVRGQYRGYRAEPDVAADSVTPTFAAMCLLVDNWRWHGVPFYLRAGKRLAKQVTEIDIRFGKVPHCLFGDGDVCARLEPNVLSLRIQPEEQINLSFLAKPPGSRLDVQREDLNFCYHCKYGTTPTEAYERLIMNVFQGDPTLFVRSDAVEAQWRIVEPLLHAWDAQPPTDFPNYDPGSWGPASADTLLAREGRGWWVGE